MPLTGIANENEFYSAYYLDAILKEDLKGVAQRWKEQAQTPDRQLGSLRQDYFKLRQRIRIGSGTAIASAAVFSAGVGDFGL